MAEGLITDTDAGTDADADAGTDGVPDDVDRIMISQRLDDIRALIVELERELRIDHDDGHPYPVNRDR